MYELVLCIGIIWAGCGVQEIITLPDKDSCFEHLQRVKIGNIGSEKKGKVIAYCRPYDYSITIK